MFRRTVHAALEGGSLGVELDDIQKSLPTPMILWLFPPTGEAVACIWTEAAIPLLKQTYSTSKAWSLEIYVKGMRSPFSEIDLRCFKIDTSHLFAFLAGLCKKDGLAAQGAESFCSVTLPSHAARESSGESESTATLVHGSDLLWKHTQIR